MENVLEGLRSLNAVAERSGIDPEAYRFLMRALGHTFEMVGEKRHVTGRELTEGFKDLLRKECGSMSPWLLTLWGVTDSMSIGRMVFDLIELNMLDKRDEDTIEDFRDCMNVAVDFPENEDVALDWRLMPVSSEGGMI